MGSGWFCAGSKLVLFYHYSAAAVAVNGCCGHILHFFRVERAFYGLPSSRDDAPPALVLAVLPPLPYFVRRAGIIGWREHRNNIWRYGKHFQTLTALGGCLAGSRGISVALAYHRAAWLVPRRGG